jgi:hypothetical protein
MEPGSMKLTIDRSQWLRGEGSENSYLLRKKDDKMCCLGFFSLQCGFDYLEIRGIKSPISLHQSRWAEKTTEGSFLFRNDGANSEALVQLMEINDTTNYPDDDIREAKIAALFSKHGVEVEFIGAKGA